MAEFQTPTLLQLRNGELLRCAERRAAWVSVLRGSVWVTRAGDLDDHFLRPGQTMRLAAGACAIVGAEGTAQLMLAQGPGRLRRCLGFVADLAARAWRLPLWVGPDRSVVRSSRFGSHPRATHPASRPCRS